MNSDGVASYVKQKPNRTIFLGFFKFHLWVYNAFSPEKIELRSLKKKKRLATRNEKRAAKEKEPIAYKPPLRERLRNSVGEPPVIFDSLLMEKSAEQIHLYLKNKGFFHNTVTAEYETRKWGKKHVKVKYTIKAGTPYKIKDISFSLEDVKMLEAAKKVGKETLLIPGNRYDVEVIDKERTRAVKKFRDLGYYYFAKDYILYKVDSTLANKQVSIVQVIKAPKNKNTQDSTQATHRKMRISKIILNATFDPKYEDNYQDSSFYKGIYMINKSMLRHKQNVLANQIFIKPGELFNQSVSDYTYKRLTGLNNFKFISIKYSEDPEKIDHLICTINLTPSTRQSLGVESEGTHTNGNLGILGNIKYANKNAFRGAERLDLKLKGGIESQPSVVSADNEENSIQTATSFNTIEYGAEVKMTIPELLIPKKIGNFKVPSYNTPQTQISVGWNFQQRTDYTRRATRLSYAYSWQGVSVKPREFKLSFPVSVISIDKTASFQQRLDTLDNPFLSNSYNNHFIPSVKFTFNWSNKENKKRTNYVRNRFNIEEAGFVTNLLMEGLNSKILIDGNNERYRELFGIRFAQFLKVDNDIRFYEVLSKNATLVYRIFGGIGIAYGNLNVLPFDRGYFSGGTNYMRAWGARKLGPGGYSYLDNTGIDQIGDLIIEGNVEYRHKLTPLIETAFFFDIGNIWLLEKDKLRQNGNFELNRFYNEVAGGAGLGLRLDFSFLIVRLDYGIKVYDPSLAPDERIIFQPKTKYREVYQNSYPWGQFNIGLGHPF